MPIACSYCGGTHPDAQSVRLCWSSGQTSAPARTPPSNAGPVDDEDMGPGFWDDDPGEATYEPVGPPAGSPNGPPRTPAAQTLARARAAGGNVVARPSTGSHDTAARPVVAAPGSPALALGRSVLVSPGQPAPEPWSGCQRVTLGPETDAAVIQDLEAAFLGRRPLVIEIASGWSLPVNESETSPIWSLGPGFSFPGERLRHAALFNSLDARGAETTWRWSGMAVPLGAEPGGPADIMLRNGRPAFVDGGPFGFLDPSELGVPEAVVIPRVAVEHGHLTPFEANTGTAELAPDQEAAVTHPGGSARIIAPAGSGKTRVLTERARHLLKNWRIPPESLCLVAFNKRAAEEIKERTTDLPGLQVRTLNSLGLAILSGTGRFGTSRSVQTVDESTVRRILEELVSFPRRANTDPAAAWIEALSSVRLGLKSPERVEMDFQGDVDGLPDVFDRYRAALAERGVVDFDEQIYRAIEILVTDPAVRERARLACRVMLVDEFQDLTPAHVLLVRLLSGPAGSVFGVGDDDQTIYGYAGASPGWLIDYATYFPGAGSHLLEVNYRCHPEVTSAARTLLTHNRTRVAKVIVSPPGTPAVGEQAQGLATDVSEDPVAATVNAVRSHVESGVDPSNIAVLSRVNSSLAPVQLSLLDAGIAVNRAVDARFLERTGVRAALAWLSIATNPGRLRAAEVSFTARRPPRAMSPKVIEWMSEQRSVERLRNLAERLAVRDADKVNNYADDIERLVEEGSDGTTETILRCLRDEIGLAAAMAALDTEHRRLDRSPQTDDLDALIALGHLHPDPKGFEGWLREGLNTPGDPDGVTLATIHAVKGREWDHVIVHNVTEGLMPHRLAWDIEEERRVFHVALTRCRLSSTVVAGTAASPFLDELTKEWEPGSAPIPATRQATASPASPQVVAVTPGAERAGKLLREWRLEKSRKEGKPAYTVFSNATLDAIAASGARSLGELARIKGVGPAKLENFGDEVLAVLDAAGD
jgi:DNA helicase-2/ATP-dependent DNA helicase PcrA